MPVVPQCPGGSLYTVARGDTLFRLAQKFGVAERALRAANPQIANPNRLVVGQRICIPQRATAGQGPSVPPPAAPPCKGGRLVRVSPGDTLASIGKRYGVTVKQLIDANPQIINPDNLVVGQNICVRRARPRSEAPA